MPLDSLEVACACDRGYLAHCATMLASLLESASRPVRAHLLVGADIDRNDLGLVADQMRGGGGELVVHEVRDDRIAALKTTATFPTAHWYRVALPDLLAEADRVLYLDCDLLVLDDLTDLWKTDLEGNLLAAVTNVFPSREGEAKLCSALSIRPGEYFNTGVLLMDLAAMRREGAGERVLAFAEANHDLLFLPDGDALNAILASRRLRLDPRWNCLTGTLRLPWSADLYGSEAVAAAREGAAIRHFEGSGANKPWHPGADEADRALYLRYRALTPWPEPGSGPGGG